MTTKQTCGECRYYDPENASGGECHANPPTVLPDWESRYPQVGKEEYACRFFEEKGEVDHRTKMLDAMDRLITAINGCGVQ